MVVALDCVIERIDADVQNTVMRISIHMDDFIYRTWLIMSGKILRSHKVAGVEESLADRSQIQKNEQNDCYTCNRHSLRGLNCPKNKNERTSDECQ